MTRSRYTSLGATTVTQDRQRNLQDLLVFFLLIAIGVAGRWGQPEWCFTPTAAAAIFAGLYFSRWRSPRWCRLRFWRSAI